VMRYDSSVIKLEVTSSAYAAVASLNFIVYINFVTQPDQSALEIRIRVRLRVAFFPEKTTKRTPDLPPISWTLTSC